MSEHTDQIRDALMEAAKADRDARDAKGLATETKQGAYAQTMRAGILAKSAEAFKASWVEFKAALVSASPELAADLRLKPNAKEPAKWQVPGSLSVAVSVVSDALEYGISLTEPTGEPRSFGQVRKDLKVAKAAESGEDAGPADGSAEYVNKIRALCASLAKHADAFTMEQAPQALAILQGLIDVACGKVEFNAAEPTSVAPESAEPESAEADMGDDDETLAEVA